MKNSISIIPMPKSLKVFDGVLTLKSNDAVVFDDASKQAGEFICKLIGLKRAEKGIIALRIDQSIKHEEGYHLSINGNGVVIRAKTETGLFYGAQTLRQMMPADIEKYKISNDITINYVEINDEPRYPYRGFMFDSVRHFFNIQTIKSLLDLMALHKLNRFHWHLSDDQGFRIEIDKYSKLIEVSSKRKESQNKGFAMPGFKQFDGIPHEGYYTKQEIEEVVQYAKERHIEIIPEIDIPGHFVAALAAYPEYSCTGGPLNVRTSWGISKDVLCVGKEQSYTFIQDILSEVIELFPYKYIHIGGDESPTKRWEKCSDCQKLKKEKGFKDERELQGYFTNRIASFLKSKGRQAICWDEVLKSGNAVSDIIVQSWTPTGGKRVRESIKKGRECIVSNFNKYYLDYPFIVMPLKNTYLFNPHLEGLSDAEAGNIFGIEAPLWTEAVDSVARIHWQMFPRLTAVCESAWTPNELKDFNGFLERLNVIEKRYDVLGIGYATKECYQYSGRPRILKILLSRDHIAMTEYKKYKAVEKG